MFKNYFKIAMRNLVNNRLYSAINIFGLAVGLGACLLLFLFINDETHFDQFWTDADKIYRAESLIQSPGRGPYGQGFTSGKTRSTLLNYFPQEIESATRFHQEYPIIQVGDKVFEEPLYLTDADTADIFDIEVLKGDLKQTLSDNRSIALSKELAIKYYGNIDVLGQVLTIAQNNSKHDYRVGAVYKKLPHNTVISFNALIKINEDDFKDQPWMFDNWASPNTVTYFKLKPNVDISAINSRLVSLVEDNVSVPEYWADQFSEATEFISFSTLPISKIYLSYAGVSNNITIFGSIALLILVIACINFTNLSIAKSTRRAREVAMRKVVGASRKQLIVQFLGETIVIAFIALIVGVALVELALPAYNNFLGRELQIGYRDPFTIVIMLALVLFAGIVGGIYPALILSSFRPAAILKTNKAITASSGFTFSNLLVIFQFIVSISLIICAVVMYAQREHAANMELGFDKDHIVILHGVGRETLIPRQQTIREQLKKLPNINSATYIHMFPATGASRTGTITVTGDKNLTKHIVAFKDIDADYQNTFNVKLLAGRIFNKEIGRDKMPTNEQWENDPGPFESNIIINELAIKQLGLGDKPADALGKILEFPDSKKLYATVVGVFSNINYRTTREAQQPELYMQNTAGAGFLAVRFNGSPIAVEKILKDYWQENITDVPFVRTFVDELVQGQFRGEQRMSFMLAVASSIAVFVACMGLFGLASFTAERRTKEIGLRKVMGANVSDIVKLLVWQFSKPVLIASVAASLLSFFLMAKWLDDFPYRIELWVIIPICFAASLCATLMAWLTIGGNAFKVARARPVKALRTE